ncbi:MAG: glycerophosphodiester phosphodiesterase [Dehalococcoidia bacterium]|nr:glycerophosphodiester phosphodiesterase [Dehalococcoidia bacterium]
MSLAHPDPFAPEIPRPVLIAHGGGNTPSAAAAALAAGADLLEVDLWLHRGRFEARHERRIRFFPFLVETWYLKRLPSAHFGLEQLLELAATAGAGVLLDLKDGGRDAAPALRDLLAAPGPRPPVVASSQSWNILRALSEAVPALPLLYSIDVRAKLDLFLAVAERDPLPRGISCRHTLLARPVVEQLRAAGLAVVAWTVDDLERARELADWGVDGITTHRVAEFRDAFRASP